MSEVKNARLEFAISGSQPDFKDVLWHECAIDEGISRPYAGTLSLSRPQPFTDGEIRALLSASFCLRIAVGVEELEITRCLKGFIRGCRYQGRRGGERFQYELSLGCPLEKLQGSRVHRSYTGMTVVEVIRRILQRLDDAITVRTDYDKGAGTADLVIGDYFDAYQILNQVAESDYDFLRRLMILYGINYTFVHEVGDTPDFKPVMYLSRSLSVLGGSSCRLGAADAVFSGAGGSNLDHIALGALHSGTAAVLGSDADLAAAGSAVTAPFLKQHMLVIDTLEAHHLPRPESFSEELSPEPCFAADAAEFGYGEAADAERLKQNFAARRATLGQDHYLGTTAELCFGPGFTCELYDLPGVPSDAAAAGAARLALLTVNSQLRLRLPDPNATEAGQVRVLFEAMDCGFDANALKIPGSFDCLPSLLWQVGFRESEQELKALGAAVRTLEGVRSGRLLEAVVCDADGAMVRTGSAVPTVYDDPLAPATFYALPQAVVHRHGQDENFALKDHILVVRCALSHAPATEVCAANFPEVGEKVVLLLSGGQYWLHSYLPLRLEERTLPGVPGQMRHRMKEWSAALSAQSDAAADAGVRIESYGITASDVRDALLCAYLDGNLHYIKQMQALAINDTRVEWGYNASVKADLDALWQEVRASYAKLGEKRREYTQTRIKAFAEQFADGFNSGLVTADVPGSKAAYEAARDDYDTILESFSKKIDELAANLFIINNEAEEPGSGQSDAGDSGDSGSGDSSDSGSGDSSDSGSGDGSDSGTGDSGTGDGDDSGSGDGSDSGAGDRSLEDEVKVVKEGNSITLRLSSDGAIHIKAPKSKIEITALNIKLNAKQKLTLRARKINTQADRSYQMSADRSSIVADHNAIIIANRLWPNFKKSKLFGSVLTVDCANGIIANAPNVTLSADIQCSLTDSMGGSLTTGMAHSAVRGHTVTLATHDPFTAITGLTKFLVQSTLGLVDLGLQVSNANTTKNGGTADENVTRSIEAMGDLYTYTGDLWLMANSIYGFRKATSGPNAPAKYSGKWWVKVVSLVLDLLCAIFDAVITTLRNRTKNVKDEDTLKSLQRTCDGLSITMNSMKMLSLSMVETPAIFACYPGYLATAMDLVPGVFSLTATKGTVSSVIKLEADAPGAGVAG